MDLTHVRNMMDNIPKGATINIKSVSQKLLDMVKKGDMEQSTMDLIIETMMSYKSREKIAPSTVAAPATDKGKPGQSTPELEKQVSALNPGELFLEDPDVDALDWRTWVLLQRFARRSYKLKGGKVLAECSLEIDLDGPFLHFQGLQSHKTLLRTRLLGTHFDTEGLTIACEVIKTHEKLWTAKVPDQDSLDRFSNAMAEIHKILENIENIENSET
ncbi:MAG: hypothetical protein MMC33_009096 [Icmadophila ericetorum]|nr:hypothetical protein [Icmadophila ericetorum]